MTTVAAPDTRSETPLTPWWLVLLEGIALLVLGVLLVIQPGQTSVIVVRLLGLYWFVAGILKIVTIFLDSTRWFWKLLVGILGIIAGFIVMEYPLWSTFAVGNSVIILLGFFGIAIGLYSLYDAFTGAGWGTGLLGAISIILGIVLLINRWLLTLSLPWVLGILAIVGGIATIVYAFRYRAAGAQPEAAVAAARPKPQVAEQVATGQAEARLGEQIVPPEVEIATAAPAAAAASITAAEEVAEESVAEAEEGAAVAGASIAAAEEVAEEGIAEPEEVAAEAAVTMEAPPAEAAVTGETAERPKELRAIEGIGPAHAQALREAGVDSLQTLLERGATPNGRAELAQTTGISGHLILKWVNHADLFRIRGIGGENAELLEAAGVDTVVELARRNAEHLHQKMVEVNAEKKLVRHVAGLDQVGAWIEQAKVLPRVVSY